MPTFPTGAVTFLFTDIEWSTKLWHADRGAMAAALRNHDLAVRTAIDANGGYVFKAVGDGFCAAFQSPVSALAAAVAAQRAIAVFEWGDISAVRVRMALHTGIAQVRDADYFGPAVNRVARLLAAGHGGQVLMTQAVVDALGSTARNGITLRDLGNHRLKDLIQPERIYQLLASGLADAFPPLNTLDARPNNLPAQPTPLLGRDTELTAVEERLRRAGTRLLTLTGPGGIGKTRLALQAAADLMDDYAHGVWFVDLSAVTEPTLVPAEIARTIGLREEGSDPIAAKLAAYLRSKALLLILDNFEQLLTATRPLAALAAACPTLTLLVTSRAPLRIAGEQAFPVPPLGVPDTRRMPGPERLLDYPAVELFVQRAAAVRTDFALTSDNAAAVAGICDRLEGLPLAIELAAARVRLLPPANLLARLKSRLDLLIGGASDRDERQRTLRGAIGWSHDLLPPSQQTLFRRLAVFAGGATLEEIKAVAEPDEALDGIEGLISQSLLRQQDGPNGYVRFTMLETIREFAAERLIDAGEADAFRAQHAQRYQALAETAEPHLTGAEQATWLDRLETEHDNLRAALAWSVETGARDEELRLTGALWRFWDAHGHLSESRARLTEALDRAGEAQAVLRAKVFSGIGVIAMAQGDLDDAHAAHEAALALSRFVGDETGIARSTGYLGWVACFRGEFDRAVPLLEEALGHYRFTQDHRGIAVILHALSEVSLIRGDYERATALGSESLAIFRARGEPSSIAKLVLHLGRLAFHAEDFSSAARHFSESSANMRAIGDLPGMQIAQVMLARSYEGLSRLDEAVGLLEDAIPAIRDLGDKGNAAFALYSLAHIAQHREDFDRARKLYIESLTIYSEIGEKVGIGECIQGIAEVFCASGSAQEGTILLGAAEAIRTASGVPLAPASLVGLERAVAAARSELGVTTFEQTFGLGRLLSTEQAVAEVTALSALS